MRGFKDLSGKHFGRWVVLHYSGKDNLGKTFWECRCACGTKRAVRGDRLVDGSSLSCGCYTKERVSETGRLAYGESSRNHVIAQYKKNAAIRNIPFYLTDEEACVLFAGECAYCGRVLSNYRKRERSYGEFRYNGIDRVDNTKGYTSDNCVSCCCVCNWMKGDMSADEFIEQIKQIHRYFVERG